ncbi:MAG: histidine kinase [Bacteroidales bacterium]
MMFKVQGSKMQVLLHMAAWAIILGLPLYFFYRWDVPRGFVWGFYINAIVNALIFYSNYLLLIPRLFMKGKRIRYFLAALGLAVGLYFISVIAGNLTFERWQNNNPGELERREAMENRDNHRPPPRTKRLLRLPYGPMHIYNYTFNVLFFTIFPLGLRVLERHSQIEKRQKELEKEKLNSELAFLKNQISPHFFFNTLNNIYALIDINKEDSQNAVLKLSRMMRYLLYESEEGETRLSNEIEFMNNSQPTPSRARRSSTTSACSGTSGTA